MERALDKPFDEPEDDLDDDQVEEINPSLIQQHKALEAHDLEKYVELKENMQDGIPT